MIVFCSVFTAGITLTLLLRITPSVSFVILFILMIIALKMRMGKTESYSMIVNLSRLGKSGTGMWQYSIKFLTALREIADVDAIICSKVHADYFEKLGYAVVTVPNIVSNTSKTSRLRPLVWYVYSYWLALRVLIKFGNKKLVCTTHHTIPLLRNQTITVHDIRPFYYPDSFIQKVYFSLFIKNVR
ncbi:protein RfbU [Salmonella enterica subsp. enterica serovar Heidelberg]|nr:protein RfbU [Salmonella enterica subsp. enterica serovar Heidelberg]